MTETKKPKEYDVAVAAGSGGVGTSSPDLTVTCDAQV
jgi:hypothetical protein